MNEVEVTTTITHIPSMEILEAKAGRTLKPGEVRQIVSNLKKGIEALIDWGTLIACAIDELET